MDDKFHKRDKENIVGQGGFLSQKKLSQGVENFLFPHVTNPEMRKKLLKQINKGMCNGLSVLWGYCNAQPFIKAPNELPQCMNGETDLRKWFNDCILLLASNGSFSAGENRLIAGFIGYMLQCHGQQNNRGVVPTFRWRGWDKQWKAVLDHIVGDINAVMGRLPGISELSVSDCAVVLNTSELIKEIISSANLNADEYILIESVNHTTCLITAERVYIFRDPNGGLGPVGGDFDALSLAISEAVFVKMPSTWSPWEKNVNSVLFRRYGFNKQPQPSALWKNISSDSVLEKGSYYSVVDAMLLASRSCFPGFFESMCDRVDEKRINLKPDDQKKIIERCYNDGDFESITECANRWSGTWESFLTTWTKEKQSPFHAAAYLGQGRKLEFAVNYVCEREKLSRDAALVALNGVAPAPFMKKIDAMVHAIMAESVSCIGYLFRLITDAGFANELINNASDYLKCAQKVGDSETSNTLIQGLMQIANSMGNDIQMSLIIDIKNAELWNEDIGIGMKGSGLIGAIERDNREDVELWIEQICEDLESKEKIKNLIAKRISSIDCTVLQYAVKGGKEGAILSLVDVLRDGRGLDPETILNSVAEDTDTYSVLENILEQPNVLGPETGPTYEN